MPHDAYTTWPSTPRLFTHSAMKSLLVLLVCSVLCANCAVFYMIQKPVPGHENECYDINTASFVSAKEVMASEPGECSRMTCLGRWKNRGALIEKATCAPTAPVPGCEVVRDLSRPYPDCCQPIVKCELPLVQEGS